MEEKKLTPEEVKQSLKLCVDFVNWDTTCSKCPYDGKCTKGRQERDALELILSYEKKQADVIAYLKYLKDNINSNHSNLTVCRGPLAPRNENGDTRLAYFVSSIAEKIDSIYKGDSDENLS